MKHLPKVFLAALLVIFTFVSTASSVAAAPPDPGDATICATIDPKLMDPTACAALVDLFSQQNNPTDGPWYNQNPRQFANKVFGGSQDEIFGERYTYAQINWIINSIAAMLNPAANVNSATDMIKLLNAIKDLVHADAGHPPTMAQYAQLGPVGMFMGATSALYANPPASGVQQVKATAQKVFDLGTGASPAYAQGYGFNGLNSGGAVSILWTATRNMSYFIMVILLIAAGFLIMFRVKINPQTVVSLQIMIPKLIITMLLVTFSFAIAGFIIDLIYIFIAAFVGFMVLGGVIQPGQLGLFGTTNTGEIIRWLTDPSFTQYYILQMFPMLMLAFIGGLVGLVIAGTPTLGGAGALGALIGAAIGVILSIWLLIILVRIFLMLVKAYVMLVLQTIIAPLQIMMDLIPGQKGFGPWFRNMIAQASVFVTVPIMLVIQNVIAWNPITNNILHLRSFGVGPNSIGGANFLLPYVNLTGKFGQGPLGSWNLLTQIIIGYVILSMTPKVADMVRDALKIPPFKYGSAIGEPLKPYTKAAGGALVGVGKDLGGAPGGVISATGEWIGGLVR